MSRARRPAALAPRSPADLARRIAAPAARDTWPWRRAVRVVSATDGLVALELECGHQAEDDNHRQRVRCRACGGAS